LGADERQNFYWRGISFNLGQFMRSFFASGVEGLTASDFNRDGKPDLAIANFGLDFRPPNLDVVFHK
jgi:hypothetical protein